jgi:hypothetical protein
MALRRELARLPNVSQNQYAILRITHAQLAKLERHVFQRYPGREWGTFFRFGYRRTAWGLALSYVEPLLPGPDDLDRRPALTRFRDQAGLSNGSLKRACCRRCAFPSSGLLHLAEHAR